VLKIDFIYNFLLLFNIYKGLTLKESHFSFKIIKKMLESKPQERPNLREIIQQLSSLKKMVMISKDLNKRKSDQFKVCS